MSHRIKLATMVAFLCVLFVVVVGLARPSGAAPRACEYWVAPWGSNSGPGTAGQPWATLAHAAATAADNSCTIWFEDGVYPGEQQIKRRFNTPTTFKAIHPYRAAFENDGPTLNVDGARNLLFEGFEFRHSGPGAADLVIAIHSDGESVWAEDIILRNNVIHDSYSDDLLKIYNGVRWAVVEGNVFYNQGPNEQHMDVNGVADLVIRGNIFFNDYVGSGRSIPGDTKNFVVVKDSGAGDDGLTGSHRVTIDGNVFLNWQGERAFFVKLGGDGQPFFEAEDINLLNNLFIGNSSLPHAGILGVGGGRNVTFNNNTVVGDSPGIAYAMDVYMGGSNPVNQNIYFYNNIWADPTGTMGVVEPGDPGRFSKGESSEVQNLVLDGNLYWNGGNALPDGQLVAPETDDAHRLVANPGLNSNQAGILLPRLDQAASLGGGLTIREEFVRLVEQYGAIPGASPAANSAVSSRAPDHDILGRARSGAPDMGAYESDASSIVLTGTAGETTLSLQWTASVEGMEDAADLLVEYSSSAGAEHVQLPVTATSHTLTGLQLYTLYQVTLLVRDAGGETLSTSNTISLLTTDIHAYLPHVAQDAG
jgi:hypothetical protein